MSFWGNDTSVRFPNLGIEFDSLPKGIAIGTFRIAFYGVVIAFGMVMGLCIARWKAKKTGQDREIYLDAALWAIPLSVIGARVYEVIFDWENYKGDFLKIINIRNGGLAIYGGIIVAILSVFTYCRIKKLRFTLMWDTAILGLILGQIIGRWGNFFNREAFGKYTDGPLAMQIELKAAGNIAYSEEYLRTLYEGKEHVLNNILEIKDHIITENGKEFIQVHPTFLYESLWNLFVLGIMLFAWPRKRFNGEIILIYLMGYGFGRFFIESIRIDQLFIWGTSLAASQILSGLLFVAALVLFIVLRTKAVKAGEPVSMELRLNPLAKEENEEEKASSEKISESEEKKNDGSEESGEKVEDSSENESKVEE